jgi:hypothetical protein
VWARVDRSGCEETPKEDISESIKGRHFCFNIVWAGTKPCVIGCVGYKLLSTNRFPPFEPQLGVVGFFDTPPQLADLPLVGPLELTAIRMFKTEIRID